MPIGLPVLHLQHFAEARHFGRREMAKLSRLERSQLQKSDFDAPQLLHQSPKMFEHEADLILPPFDQPHFVPGISAALGSASGRPAPFVYRPAERLARNFSSCSGVSGPFTLTT